MTCTSAKASSIFIIASLLAMLGGPLVAAAPHEVCGSMRHDCDKIDALASCCCGDRSDVNPSQTPSARVEGANAALAAMAVPAFDMPVLSPVFFSEVPVNLARPPDLPILFSDLRI